MKKSEKIVISILVLITIVIIIAFFMMNQKNMPDTVNKNEENVKILEDGTKENTSKVLKQNKNIDGLEISDISLKEIGGITTLLATITNNNTETTEQKEIKIEILDKDDNVLTTLRGNIDAMKPKETKQFNMAVTADVANAYDFRISKIK